MTAVQTEQVTFTEGMRVRVADPAYTEDGGYVMPNFYGQVGTITGVHTEDGWYVQHPEREHLTNTIGARYLTPVTEDEVTESASTETPERLPLAVGTQEVPVPLAIGMRVTIADGALRYRGRALTESAYGKVGEIQTGPEPDTGYGADTVVWLVSWDGRNGYRESEWIRAEYLTPESAEDALRRQVETLTRERDEARTARDTAVTDLASFKETVQTVGLQYAEDNDLCGIFDKCMEELGLEGRERGYDIPVRVDTTITVSVTATSRSKAEDAVTDELVRQVLGYRYTGLDWEVEDEEDY